MSARTYDYQDYWINPRIKIAALWTAMLFIFVYVDFFGLFRSDVRADIEAGKIFAFTIGQGVLLGMTIYVMVPSLMVLLSLVLPVRVTRMANLVLAVLYAVTVAGAPSASGTTTSSEASPRPLCWQVSPTTHGPGRRRLTSCRRQTSPATARECILRQRCAGSPGRGNWLKPSIARHRIQPLTCGDMDQWLFRQAKECLFRCRSGPRAA